ncbi:hypothetical protein M4I32_00245 [Microbacterium sp. LRZ72]|uniref:DUF6716 putative glycosyltransferase n=1 Tax=Microbacterium sp. LRZ72 TaxID=2942481 RepID=UPI0029A3C1FF|nr:DUF6716 putative glycosyltransferase [Microbacterium sp. LRZ72]MDX2375233.1 hypothetical protein [Microbacterium sp. LRZ72]
MSLGSALRVVALADTDSYVKWGAALLASRPDAIDATLLIVETPLVVSAAQQRAAVAGSGLSPERVRRVAHTALADELGRLAPDAVLIAARGPLARVLARAVASLEPRPVIVTGLPGISIPATRKALHFRMQSDLFVLHSHREVREFAALATERGVAMRFGLARLPFARSADPGAHDGWRPDGDLVFAAQAIVPRERADRRRVAALLRAAAHVRPDQRVVLKLRAVRGEHQTHAERDGYVEMLAELGPVPANLVVSTEPMARALKNAQGLVTVSSTAAIEAVARGIPVIALDTFGVSDDLINTVFVGSGLLAGEDAVIARDLRLPDAAWLRENYLHDAGDDDWVPALAALVARRRAGTLPPRPPLRRTGGRVRDAFEHKLAFGGRDRSVSGLVALSIGAPLREVVRLCYRVRRLVGERQPVSRSAPWMRRRSSSSAPISTQ